MVKIRDRLIESLIKKREIFIGTWRSEQMLSFLVSVMVHARTRGDYAGLYIFGVIVVCPLERYLSR